MYKRDTGTPTSPPGAPCHRASPCPKARPCSGLLAALNGEGQCWGERMGWGSPLSYRGHGWGRGANPKPSPKPRGSCSSGGRAGTPVTATGDTGAVQVALGGFGWHRGDAAGRAGALQCCDSVTRGPHAPSPTRAGDTDAAPRGGPAPTSGISRALPTHLSTSRTALEHHPAGKPRHGLPPPLIPHPRRWQGAGGPFPTYPDVTVVPLPSLMIICWQSCSVRRSPSLSSVRAASASIPMRWPGPARKLGGR